MQAIEENLSVPAIFKDAAYTKALHYKLSTSQVWNVYVYMYKYTTVFLKAS